MDVMDEEPEVARPARRARAAARRRSRALRRTSASDTGRGPRCCTAWTSTSRPARRSRSSATRARASPRSPSCSRASTTRCDGRITIDGHRSARRHAAFAPARSSGIVPQEGFLFAGTVTENIAFGRPDATPEEVVQAAQTVGAHDFILRLEDGYETQLQERGSRLSLGQRQLVALARALLADPQDPHPRRGDVVGRHRHGAQDRAGAAAPARGPDGVHHRPPTVHDPRRRPDRRAASTGRSSSRAPTTSCSDARASTRRSTETGRPRRAALKGHARAHGPGNPPPTPLASSVSAKTAPVSARGVTFPSGALALRRIRLMTVADTLLRAPARPTARRPGCDDSRRSARSS